MLTSVLACGPRGVLSGACLLSALLCAHGCGSSQPLPVPANTEGRGSDDGNDDAGTNAVEDAGTGRMKVPNLFQFDAPDASVATCACGVNGECITNDDGNPECQCVKGYKASDPLGPCEEDLGCVELTPLTCRAVWGGNTGAGNGILLSASYCSGRPYTDVTTEDLLIEIKEEGKDAFEPTDPDESVPRVVPRDTISHLYFAIDISQSVTANEDNLTSVAAAIGTLIDRLGTMNTEYRVSIFLFDGVWYLYEWIPETTDLAAVRAQLDVLHLQRGQDPGSSNVRGAVKSVIDRIERSFQLKSLSSRFGVLNTGMVVVISDGDDAANFITPAEVQARIDETRVKLITVRVGNEDEFAELAALGRDGSFNAGTPEELDDAFVTIGDRLEAFEDSIKYIGYCATARAGLTETRLSLRSVPGPYAKCTYDADNFQPGCGPETLDPNTNKGCLFPDGSRRECGGLLACGMCDPGECCNNGRCEAAVLKQDDEKCANKRQCEWDRSCEMGMSSDVCLVPEYTLGQTCDADGVCNPGVLACVEVDTDVHQCEGARPLGAACDRWEDCTSLNCAPRRPLTNGPRMCLPKARMFERCNNDALCEAGSYCERDICQPHKFSGNPCKNDHECRSGVCEFDICAYSLQCYYDFELDIGPELFNLQ